MEPTPLLGIVGGIGVAVAGVLVFIFARNVGRFFHRLFDAFVSRRYADFWATTGRMKAIGIAFTLAGIALFIVAMIALGDPRVMN